MEEKIIEKLDSIQSGISEILNNQEDATGDEYTFKTTSFEKAKLFSNLENLVNALIDIRTFRRDIYKGYNDKAICMTEGYTYANNLVDKVNYEIPKNEYTNSKFISVMPEEDIIKKIDEIFDENDIWNILENY